MAKISKTRTINLSITPNTFSYIFQRFRGEKSEYDFSNLADLRRMLSNEKSKLLYVIKNDKPESIYKLAKLVSRDFKSVLDDIKLLERFGFIELEKALKGNRKMLTPKVLADSLQVNFHF